MRTELVWEGKYDEFGNRRDVDSARLGMPLQKIETIDEPRSRAEGQGELFDEKKAHRDDFRNRLIWGDNKLVCASLLSEFRGSFDVVYIDPPFDVGADFTMAVPIGETGELKKDQSILEMIAYRDTWGRGIDSYASMIAERLQIIRDLIHETGSILVHCDWRVSAVVRMILDEIFGRENMIGHIVWQRTNARGTAGRWPRIAEIFERVHEGLAAVAALPSAGHRRDPLLMGDTGLFLLDAVIAGELAVAAEQLLLLPAVTVRQREAVIARELAGHGHQLLFEEGELHRLAGLRIDAGPDDVAVLAHARLRRGDQPPKP